MPANLRKWVLVAALPVFLGSLVYGSRYRTFVVYTQQTVDGEVFSLENEDVPEFRLNIASTFGGASVDANGQLLGNPYDWVNVKFRLCPT